ncbi:hypothetical protein TELCIR_02744 [Teladorsagia circumcincta]|uniref:Uncharacterized protein n=1 Tax=Teladorsagia circumcincta TaxID=45464 RepID=A0A2G9UZR7_TELCI|nr:hypothetical protein TELCIR_02744 [Teladorsagia circumcincta]
MFAKMTQSLNGVKRQYGSPAHLQQWSVDQRSYQQPLGYRESYIGTEDYYPNADYYNYYTQRAIVPHQAPRSWTLDGYNGYNYIYPPSSYNTHGSQHSSGYAVKPVSSNVGSSYGRPIIVGEVTQAPIKNSIPIGPSTTPKDEYPTPPPEWEGGPDMKFFARENFPVESIATLSSQEPDTSTKATSSVRFFEGEGFDENGPFASHGVEVVSGGEPVSSNDSFLKAAVEEDINETKAFPSSTPSGGEIGKSSSTTSEPKEEELNPSDNDSDKKIVEVAEGTTTITPSDGDVTTPQAVIEEATALFVDNEDSFVPTNTESVPETTFDSSSPSDSTVVSEEKFIPTEVPASDVFEVTTESTDSASSNATVILRSPPLPMQVAEKLKELGFTVLRLFS